MGEKLDGVLVDSANMSVGGTQLAGALGAVDTAAWMCTAACVYTPAAADKMGLNDISWDINDVNDIRATIMGMLAMLTVYCGTVHAHEQQKTFVQLAACAALWQLQPMLDAHNDKKTSNFAMQCNKMSRTIMAVTLQQLKLASEEHAGTTLTGPHAADSKYGAQVHSMPAVTPHEADMALTLTDMNSNDTHQSSIVNSVGRVGAAVTAIAESAESGLKLSIQTCSADVSPACIDMDSQLLQLPSEAVVQLPAATTPTAVKHAAGTINSCCQSSAGGLLDIELALAVLAKLIGEVYAAHDLYGRVQVCTCMVITNWVCAPLPACWVCACAKGNSGSQAAWPLSTTGHTSDKYLAAQK